MKPKKDISWVIHITASIITIIVLLVVIAIHWWKSAQIDSQEARLTNDSAVVRSAFEAKLKKYRELESGTNTVDLSSTNSVAIISKNTK